MMKINIIYIYIGLLLIYKSKLKRILKIVDLVGINFSNFASVLYSYTKMCYEF